MNRIQGIEGLVARLARELLMRCRELTTTIDALEAEIASLTRPAVGASGVAHVGHEFRWHPHDVFAGCQQIALQAPRKVAAILDGPLALATKLRRKLQQA